jgi:hypothetical protein
MPDVDDDRIRAYREGCANYARTDVEARAYAITQCDLCDYLGYCGVLVCDHTDRTATHQAGIAKVRAVLAENTKRRADREAQA